MYGKNQKIENSQTRLFKTFENDRNNEKKN